MKEMEKMDTKIFLETLESLGLKAEIERVGEYIKLNLDKEESFFRTRSEEKRRWEDVSISYKRK